MFDLSYDSSCWLLFFLDIFGVLPLFFGFVTGSGHPSTMVESVLSAFCASTDALVLGSSHMLSMMPADNSFIDIVGLIHTHICMCIGIPIYNIYI